MKTKIKLLAWAVLLLITFKSYSQCNSAFANTNYGGGTVSFQSTAYPDTGVNGQRYYLWSFGDGGTDSTVVAYDVHTYTISGSYTACLTVVDPSASCSNQSCDTVVINLCADNTNFYSSLIGFGYDTFTTNLPSGGSFTAEWDFGDGSGNGIGINTSHQYTSNGNYNVCVAINGPGCADTICKQVNVTLCQSYNPDFTFNLVSSNPYIGVFLPTYPNPSGYSYSWWFPANTWTNGDTTFYPMGNNASITMSVSSGACSDSVTKTFNLDWCNLQPTAYESSNGYVANFSALVADTTQPGVTYGWRFPGASSATDTGEFATATYPAYGTYGSWAIIYAPGGCTDTIYQLVVITPGVYSIGGQISGGTSNGNATVYLIIQDSTGHLALADSGVLQFIDTGIGGNNVNYYFNNLAAGTYYVKAALDSPNTAYYDYLPTYYTSSLSWSTATPVAITTGNIYGIDITLTPGTNPGGPGFVGGYVSQGAGLLVQPNGGNVTRGVGDALGGVQINLLTSNDEAVAYTYTDANGHYQFRDLAYGSYKIYAEQLNKIPGKIPFTLSPSDSSITSLNFSINSDSSYATAINNVNQVLVEGIYPNPVVNKLEVQLSSQQAANATYKLIDILGNTLVSNNTKLALGDNRLEIDMENLAAGVYQLLIQTNDQHLIYQVVKAK